MKFRRRIILASASPRRSELLKKLGLRFEVEPSDYEEDMNLKIPPRELAKVLSRGKAEAVARRHKNAIVIGADTFIVYRNKAVGKPRSAAEAKRMLGMLSGKAHLVISGLTVIDTRSGKTVSKACETKVGFRKILPREIDGYVSSGEPLDYAGAYGLQGIGNIFLKKLEGEYSNVVGLPLNALARVLEDLGVKIF